MANVITMQMLKMYAPSLVNRGQSGEPKSVKVGGVLRSRISSQCIKKAVRNYAGLQAYRTANMQDLIKRILKECVDAGRITEDESDKLGSVICNTLNCKWTKKADNDKGEAEKGNVTIYVTPVELSVIVETAIRNKDKDKELPGIIKKALDEVRISVDKAMFGIMATGGELGTVDGAVQVAQIYGIDAFVPESDFITATFSSPELDDSDPFYGSCKGFSDDNLKKAASETIADAWLYSNVMYVKTAVNIKELKRNLSTSVTLCDMTVPDDVIRSDMKDGISRYFEGMAVVSPEAKQNSMLTNSFPSICYIESIKDGTALYADPYFEKVICGKENSSVSEQGIERMLAYAKGKKHSIGDVKRYVLLDDLYESYEADFEQAGVTVLHSLDELKEIIGQEVERLDV